MRDIALEGRVTLLRLSCGGGGDESRFGKAGAGNEACVALSVNKVLSFFGFFSKRESARHMIYVRARVPILVMGLRLSAQLNIARGPCGLYCFQEPNIPANPFTSF